MRVVSSCLVLLLAACGASSLRLERVVLHQNGIGYFERRGRLDGEVVSMRFSPHEVDDVLGTLTVLDAAGGETVVSASVPARTEGETEVTLDLRMPDARARQLAVTYAVPTPAWRAVYRVVLPADGSSDAVFQIWALVHNASAEPWEDVRLELATSAPFSFAVDLRTPTFVPRPDVTGRLVTPVLTGAVIADRAEATAAPPAASFDADGDRIADTADACPSDPETYNGTEDEDGCPDRGTVVITEDSISILEQIYFPARSAEISERMAPILDAVAQTLIGSPQITSVRIDGHAAASEPDAWTLSAERAMAVRAGLIERRVPAARLIAEPFAATQPVDPRTGAEADESNRRVSFFILGTVDGPTLGETAAVVPSVVAEASHAEVAEIVREEGSSRFVLSSAVTVPARSSTLVTLASVPVEGSAVLVYRPDPSAVESGAHPFMAAQVRTPGATTLIAGAVAIYAEGAFVGEGLIEHGEPGEVATIPFAIDHTTFVSHAARDRREAVRFLSVDGPQARLEDRVVTATTYTIDPGDDVRPVLVLHHRRRAGTTPRDLPPQAEVRSDEIVIRLPITSATRSTFTIEETVAVTVELSLLHDLAPSLSDHLAGSSMEPAVRDRLAAALASRAALEAADAELRALRERASDAVVRTAELRANLRAVTAPALRRTLTERLAEAAASSERLTAELDTASARVAELRVTLSVALEGLAYAAP